LKMLWYMEHADINLQRKLHVSTVNACDQ